MYVFQVIGCRNIAEPLERDIQEWDIKSIQITCSEEDMNKTEQS